MARPKLYLIAGRPVQALRQEFRTESQLAPIRRFLEGVASSWLLCGLAVLVSVWAVTVAVLSLGRA